MQALFLVLCATYMKIPRGHKGSHHSMFVPLTRYALSMDTRHFEL